MRLFKKKSLHSPQDDKPSLNDKAAKGIAGFILKMQTGFAKLLSRWTKNLSIPTMKAGLIIFCLIGFSLSIYFIVITLLKKDQLGKIISIDRLTVPKYYDKTDEEYPHPDFFITKQQHEEMQAFQIYMDSLHQSKTGKPIYDSIVILRPHLLDSVKALEEIYQSQLQNKK
jgi:hypothetical protein